MTQRTEHAGVRIVERHGANAGHAVPNPCADAVDTVVIGLWRHCQRLNGGSPPDLELHFLTLRGMKHPLKLLRRCHGLAVAFQDCITGLQSAGSCGGTTLRQLDHQHALGEKLDPDGMPNRNQGPGGGCCGCILHRGCLCRSGKTGQTQGQAETQDCAAPQSFFLLLKALMQRDHSFPKRRRLKFAGNAIFCGKKRVTPCKIRKRRHGI